MLFSLFKGFQLAKIEACIVNSGLHNLSEIFNYASNQAAHTKGELEVMHCNQLIFSI
jgi:hypothetical protein